MMPLGMEDRRILPGQLRASSVYNYNYGPDRGRLNQFAGHSRTGGWMAKYRNKNQWYQIDLGQLSIVKGIATQGRRGAHYWVKTYQLSYSRLGAQFKTFVSFGRVKVIGISHGSDKNLTLHCSAEKLFFDAGMFLFSS